MSSIEKSCLICSCDGTVSLDTAALEKNTGLGKIRFMRNLCRDDVDMLRDTLNQAEHVSISCTQESLLFDEIRDDVLGDIADDATPLRLINIRERAGWTTLAVNRTDKINLTAKIAALLAEAQVASVPPQTVQMRSGGSLWILGRDQTALDAAGKLAGRLDITVLLDESAEIIPPRQTRYPVFAGRVARASGHLGAFQLDIVGMRRAAPSSSDRFQFVGTPEDGTGVADLVLDLRRAAPLFPAWEKRDGYFRPDPGSPAAIGEALFALTDMTGDYEKPRYIDYDRNICAHSRSRITGCSRCIDTCPTGAAMDDGDGIRFDPYVCAGCGSCASACPTGAAHYGPADGNNELRRLRQLLRAYTENGGTTPVLLIHDESFGTEAIDLIARCGIGLPPHVIPFAVSHVTQVGLDTLLTAAAYGAAHCALLMAPDDTHGRPVLDEQIAFAAAITEGLGYTDCRVEIIDEADPDAMARRLAEIAAPAALKTAGFEPAGRKRTVMRLALDHLHAHAPHPVDAIALPKGAPFGTVMANRDACTLCMSCVGACPTGALRDNPESPQLSFVEDACVQCGLCAKTCPESALTLTPRLGFGAAIRDARVLNEDAPFHCVSCGKAFATAATLERLTTKLTGHAMFANPHALERLKMCETCRVIDMTESDDSPFAAGLVPKTRTTSDYLAGRIGKDDGSDAT